MSKSISRDRPEQDPCCGSSTASASRSAGPPARGARSERAEPYTRGWIDSHAGPVPRLATVLTRRDRLGTCKVRWGIGRNRYTVRPGLYGIGNPKPDSPLLATANYKLSVDRLRESLAGIDAWVLVLDTRGINVWCAAGKGTFGTDELERRLVEARAGVVVSHRKLILPQLGAPGVRAHEITKRTGFHVVYGPVRAEDLPEFLRSGLTATEEMRRVRFNLADRLTQVPVELTTGLKPLLLAIAAVAVLSPVVGRTLAPGRIGALALAHVSWMLVAYLAASVLSLALLPWLPGRPFSLKGLWIGLPLSVLCWIFFRASPALGVSAWGAAGWMILLPAITSFIAMNFTGSTPFTSLSGVKYEMRRAVPLQIFGAVVALALWITGAIVG